MSKIKPQTPDKIKETLFQGLISAGYNMAALQLTSMIDNPEDWEGDIEIINGKVNPKCIDIGEQSYHSLCNNELDMWFEVDNNLLPEGYGNGRLNELFENNHIAFEEVLDLLEEGCTKYINEKYGKGWEDAYPDPQY